MKKCLVIGGSSFIGVYTVNAFLNAHWEVVATGRNKRFADYYTQLGVEYITLDMDTPEDLGKLPTDFDVVCHLAGRLPANSEFNLATEDDADAYMKTNVLGVIALLEWCRCNGISRIVSTTSYADVQNKWSASEPVREDWPRDFKYSGDHAAYVISKNAACDLLWYYNSQYGMSNVVFRLPPVYGCGPHESLRVNGVVKKSGIGLFVERAKAGDPITVFGDADCVKRDVVYVKDVAQAFLCAAESEYASGLYNIGSGAVISLLEQAEVIADVFAGSNGRSEVSIDKNRENGIVSYCFDISKAKKDLKYAPMYSDFHRLMTDWKRVEEEGIVSSLFDISTGSSR